MLKRVRNGGLIWPHCGGLNWPHLRPTGDRPFELMELEREAAEGMGSRVQTFEQIRRDRDQEGLSIRALGERHGVHRRAVRQALAAPLPPPKRKPLSRPAPKLGPYRELIDSWLASRPRRAAQAAPHRQADLGAPERGARRRCRAAHGSGIRSSRRRERGGGRAGVRAADPCGGRGGRGRLGRGAGRDGRCAEQGLPVPHARVALRRGVCDGLRMLSSRRSWRPTCRRLTGSAGCSACCATTT